MIDIMNKNYEPSLPEIIQFNNGERFVKLLTYISDKYKTKATIKYSGCSAMPGWNIKYKKSGKALCTIYPRKGNFTVLIVLTQNDNEWFKDNDFSEYVVNKYESSGMLNGTRWVMIDVTSDEILNDVMKIMKLKTENN